MNNSKNKMIPIIILILGISLVTFGIMYWISHVFPQPEEATYTAPETVECGTAGNELCGTSTSTDILSSHIVSITGETFNKLFVYAVQNNMTVSDAVTSIVDSNSTTTLNNLYQKGVKDGISEEVKNQVEAVATCTPDGVVSFIDTATGKTYSFYCKDKI